MEFHTALEDLFHHRLWWHVQVLGAESHSLPLRIIFVCFDERAWLWILVCSSKTSVTWMLDFLNYFSIVWLFINLLAFSLAAVAFSLSFIIVREFPEEWRAVWGSAH